MRVLGPFADGDRARAVAAVSAHRSPCYPIGQSAGRPAESSVPEVTARKGHFESDWGRTDPQYVAEALADPPPPGRSSSQPSHPVASRAIKDALLSRMEWLVVEHSLFSQKANKVFP